MMGHSVHACLPTAFAAKLWVNWLISPIQVCLELPGGKAYHCAVVPALSISNALPGLDTAQLLNTSNSIHCFGK